MHLQNLRLGLATNSSSSHSIIFNPQLVASDEYDEYFGWDFFTLASKQARDKYAAAMIYQNLARDDDYFSHDLAMVILRGLGFEQSILDVYAQSEDDYVIGSIDHQSLYCLPKRYGTNAIDIKFFRDFREYLLRDGMVILGGNDNDDKNHPLFDEDHVITLDRYHPDYSGFICRQDGDWYTLFNPKNGTRATFSFKDNPAEYKPLTPLLCDYCVSSYCSSNCDFCYVDSTKNGKHADTNDLYRHASMIGHAQVFEVAIGGGDPIECPHLESFIDNLHLHGVPVVNFTTKQHGWLENERFATNLITKIGAFALSVDNNTNQSILDRIVTIFKYRNYDLEKFTIQIIPAVFSKWSLDHILKWANSNRIRVTLLGFKTTGRGAEYKLTRSKNRYDKFNEDEWIEVIKQLSDHHECPQFAIDTVLAKNSLEILQQLQIPDYLYHVTEGFSSMFINGVENKAGPSSYHLDKLIDLDMRNPDAIAHAFEQIEEV